METYYRVLIVDDEPSIREGLPSLIDWKSYGFEVVGTASNGFEGIEKAVEFQANLIVTDIQMPIIDGIEMTRLIKQSGDISPEFIFISGYSEFEYAKEAIQFGVNSYLLKPIDEDELVVALVKIRKNLDELVIENQSSENLKTNEQLKRIIIKKEEIASNFNPFGSEPFRLIEIGGYDSFKTSITDLQSLWERHFEQQYYLFPYGVSNYIITTEKDMSSISKFISDINSSEVNVFIGELSLNFHTLFEEVLMLRESKYLYPNETVFSLEYIAGYSENTSVYNGHFEEEILVSLKDGNMDRILKLMSAFRDHNRHLNCTSILVKSQISSLYWYIHQSLDSGLFSDRNPHLDMKDVYSSQNIDHIISIIEQILLDLLTRSKALLKNKTITEEIKDYTKANFALPITLKMIADEFNYNSAYIGKKFKEEVGYFYSRYLDEIRIEYAKEQLIETNLLVYEIAQNAGFNNLDYFHKKFKDHTLLSPGEFRKERGLKHE